MVFRWLFYTVWKTAFNVPLQLLLTEFLRLLVQLTNSSLILLWAASLKEILVLHEDKQSWWPILFVPVLLDHLLTFQVKTGHDIVTFALHAPHLVVLCSILGYPLMFWKLYKRTYFAYLCKLDAIRVKNVTDGN